MDKYIVIILNGSDFEDFLNKPHDEELYICDTIDEFMFAISKKVERIVTTQTHAFSSRYYEMGYEIIAIYKGKEMKMSDVLAGVGGYTERDIRLAHNWEKMLFNGEFSIWEG